MTPDQNIQGLQASDPKLYNAIKNLGSGSQQLISQVFPQLPQPLYKGRIIIPGNPSVATDILSHRYHVVMPIDPSGYWNFLNVVLTSCYITAKTVGTTSTLSVDILMSQQKGTTPYKSLFKPGLNPMLPKTVVTTHNVEFSISNLYQDDLGRVDILATDAAVADIEIVLTGYYNLQEVQVS